MASADCGRASATDFSLKCNRVFFEFAGPGTHCRGPAARNFQNLKFPVWKFLSSRAYTRGTCRHRAGGRRTRMEAASGGESRQELTVTVTPDIGGSEKGGRCSPTSAGVRRRPCAHWQPEPSLRRGCALRNRSENARAPFLNQLMTASALLRFKLVNVDRKAAT